MTANVYCSVMISLMGAAESLSSPLIMLLYYFHLYKCVWATLAVWEPGLSFGSLFFVRGSLKQWKENDNCANVAIVPFWYLPLSTFQLNMVRQRKDGDSLERLDGSKPTWKVCLDAWLILSRVCWCFRRHKLHHSHRLTVIHLAA